MSNRKKKMDEYINSLSEEELKELELDETDGCFIKILLIVILLGFALKAAFEMFP